MNGKYLSQLLDAKNKALTADVLIKALQTDSRKIQPGDLFIAYPGLQVDGRDYIKEALDKKAAAVFYEANQYNPSIQTKVPLIPFENLQHRIGEIAARFYDDPSCEMEIIGITGTNGKTSCAQFIAQALQSQGIRCGVIGTLGYGFLGSLHKISHTTPEPIQLQQAFAEMRKQGAKAIAMEVSSHALHQRRVEGVQFDIAVFTQLSRDHLDYHGDMENYARAKELLFQQPGLHTGVVNCDDALGKRIIAHYRHQLTLVGYSANGVKDDRVSSVIASAIQPLAQGFSVEVQTPWGEGTFTTPLFGRFNISNLLAVLSVLCLCEIPFDKALLELSQLRNVPGRMQVVDSQRQPQIIVDYAHTPDALEKALTALREHCQGRLICVFGCGGDRDRGKRPQMAAVAEQHADQIILTNDNPRTESPLTIIQDIQAGFKNKNAVLVKLDRAEAIRYAVQMAAVNDIVLIAGKGHETTQTIADQVLPFNDVEEAKKAL